MLEMVLRVLIEELAYEGEALSLGDLRQRLLERPERGRKGIPESWDVDFQFTAFQALLNSKKVVKKFKKSRRSVSEPLPVLHHSAGGSAAVPGGVDTQHLGTPAGGAAPPAAAASGSLQGGGSSSSTAGIHLKSTKSKQLRASFGAGAFAGHDVMQTSSDVVVGPDGGLVGSTAKASADSDAPVLETLKDRELDAIRDLVENVRPGGNKSQREQEHRAASSPKSKEPPAQATTGMKKNAASAAVITTSSKNKSSSKAKSKASTSNKESSTSRSKSQPKASSPAAKKKAKAAGTTNKAAAAGVVDHFQGGGDLNSGSSSTSRTLAYFTMLAEKLLVQKQRHPLSSEFHDPDNPCAFFDRHFRLMFDLEPELREKELLGGLHLSFLDSASAGAARVAKRLIQVVAKSRHEGISGPDIGQALKQRAHDIDHIRRKLVDVGLFFQIPLTRKHAQKSGVALWKSNQSSLFLLNIFYRELNLEPVVAETEDKDFKDLLADHFDTSTANKTEAAGQSRKSRSKDKKSEKEREKSNERTTNQTGTVLAAASGSSASSPGRGTTHGSSSAFLPVASTATRRIDAGDETGKEKSTIVPLAPGGGGASSENLQGAVESSQVHLNDLGMISTSVVVPQESENEEDLFSAGMQEHKFQDVEEFCEKKVLALLQGTKKGILLEDDLFVILRQLLPQLGLPRRGFSTVYKTMRAQLVRERKIDCVRLKDESKPGEFKQALLLRTKTGRKGSESMAGTSNATGVGTSSDINLQPFVIGSSHPRSASIELAAAPPTARQISGSSAAAASSTSGGNYRTSRSGGATAGAEGSYLKQQEPSYLLSAAAPAGATTISPGGTIDDSFHNMDFSPAEQAEAEMKARAQSLSIQKSTSKKNLYDSQQSAATPERLRQIRRFISSQKSLLDVRPGRPVAHPGSDLTNATLMGQPTVPEQAILLVQEKGAEGANMHMLETVLGLRQREAQNLMTQLEKMGVVGKVLESSGKIHSNRYFAASLAPKDTRDESSQLQQLSGAGNQVEQELLSSEEGNNDQAEAYNFDVGSTTPAYVQDEYPDADGLNMDDDGRTPPPIAVVAPPKGRQNKKGVKDKDLMSQSRTPGFEESGGADDDNYYGSTTPAFYNGSTTPAFVQQQNNMKSTSQQQQQASSAPVVSQNANKDGTTTAQDSKRRRNLTSETRAKQVVAYFDERPDVQVETFNVLRRQCHPEPSDARTMRFILDLALELRPDLRIGRTKRRFEINFVWHAGRCSLEEATDLVGQLYEEKYGASFAPVAVVPTTANKRSRGGDASRVDVLVESNNVQDEVGRGGTAPGTRGADDQQQESAVQQQGSAASTAKRRRILSTEHDSSSAVLGSSATFRKVSFSTDEAVAPQVAGTTTATAASSSKVPAFLTQSRDQPNPLLVDKNVRNVVQQVSADDVELSTETYNALVSANLKKGSTASRWHTFDPQVAAFYGYVRPQMVRLYLLHRYLLDLCGEKKQWVFETKQLVDEMELTSYLQLLGVGVKCDFIQNYILGRLTDEQKAAKVSTSKITNRTGTAAMNNIDFSFSSASAQVAAALAPVDRGATEASAIVAVKAQELTAEATAQLDKRKFKPDPLATDSSSPAGSGSSVLSDDGGVDAQLARAIANGKSESNEQDGQQVEQLQTTSTKMKPSKKNHSSSFTEPRFTVRMKEMPVKSCVAMQARNLKRDVQQFRQQMQHLIKLGLVAYDNAEDAARGNVQSMRVRYRIHDTGTVRLFCSILDQYLADGEEFGRATSVAENHTKVAGSTSTAGIQQLAASSSSGAPAAAATTKPMKMKMAVARAKGNKRKLSKDSNMAEEEEGEQVLEGEVLAVVETTGSVVPALLDHAKLKKQLAEDKTIPTSSYDFTQPAGHASYWRQLRSQCLQWVEAHRNASIGMVPGLATRREKGDVAGGMNPFGDGRVSSRKSSFNRMVEEDQEFLDDEGGDAGDEEENQVAQGAGTAFASAATRRQRNKHASAKAIDYALPGLPWAFQPNQWNSNELRITHVQRQILEDRVEQLLRENQNSSELPLLSHGSPSVLQMVSATGLDSERVLSYIEKRNATLVDASRKFDIRFIREVRYRCPICDGLARTGAAGGVAGAANQQLLAQPVGSNTSAVVGGSSSSSSTAGLPPAPFAVAVPSATGTVVQQNNVKTNYMFSLKRGIIDHYKKVHNMDLPADEAEYTMPEYLEQVQQNQKPKPQVPFTLPDGRSVRFRRRRLLGNNKHRSALRVQRATT
eukprot:GSA120T00012873001.1